MLRCRSVALPECCIDLLYNLRRLLHLNNIYSSQCHDQVTRSIFTVVHTGPSGQHSSTHLPQKHFTCQQSPTSTRQVITQSTGFIPASLLACSCLEEHPNCVWSLTIFFHTHAYICSLLADLALAPWFDLAMLTIALYASTFFVHHGRLSPGLNACTASNLPGRPQEGLICFTLLSPYCALVLQRSSFKGELR